MGLFDFDYFNKVKNEVVIGKITNTLFYFDDTISTKGSSAIKLTYDPYNILFTENFLVGEHLSSPNQLVDRSGTGISALLTQNSIGDSLDVSATKEYFKQAKVTTARETIHLVGKIDALYEYKRIEQLEMGVLSDLPIFLSLGAKLNIFPGAPRAASGEKHPLGTLKINIGLLQSTSPGRFLFPKEIAAAAIEMVKNTPLGTKINQI